MHKKATGGFTLIEAMITICILSIGLLALASMQTSAIRDNSFSSGLTEASALAQQKMEELMELPYDDPLLDDTDNDGTNQDQNDNGVDDDNDNKDPDKSKYDFGLWHDDTVATADHNENQGDYNLFWNIAIDEPISNTKTIRVIVTWDEGSTPRRAFFDFIRSDTH